MNNPVRLPCSRMKRATKSVRKHVGTL